MTTPTSASMSASMRIPTMISSQPPGIVIAGIYSSPILTEFPPRAGRCWRALPRTFPGDHECRAGRTPSAARQATPPAPHRQEQSPLPGRWRRAERRPPEQVLHRPGGGIDGRRRRVVSPTGKGQKGFGQESVPPLVRSAGVSSRDVTAGRACSEPVDNGAVQRRSLLARVGDHFDQCGAPALAHTP